MPGNEVGDRLHFFAQENISQGQHQAQALDGNWPALDNNLLVGSQRQIGSKSQLQSQQQHYNDYMYGHPYQARQDEGKFIAVNSGSDQRNVASLGSSFYESQQGFGSEHRTHTPVRSEASESPGSFDLFGSQHQFSSHQSNMLQPSQQQQPGFNMLQQQMMFMKMQELQRQQHLQQLSAREQNAFNQISPFPNLTASIHSSPLVNGNMNSGGLSYPLASETGNTHWLQRNYPVLQGSSNGLISTNRAQGQNLMGLIPQQSDQSLYGVPVSGQMMADRAYVQKTDSFNNLFPSSQYLAMPDQVSGHDRALNSKQKFQGENIFGNAPSGSLNSSVNMENLQQVNPMQRSTAVQEFQSRQELPVASVNSLEKTSAQAASSHDDVGLDPTEEKILFGSDDNIWAAFGKSNDLTGETGNSVDGTGTWSALMQSAVAETSSADAQPQEEWSGLNLHTTNVPSKNQNISGSEPVRPSDENVNDRYNNFQGFQQCGHKLPHGLQTSSSQRLVPPFEEGNKWMETGSLQRVGGVHGGTSYKADPGPNPAVDLQSVANGSNPFLSSSSQINHWKTANASVKGIGSESFEGSQSLRDNRFLNSLRISSDREVKSPEMDTRDKQENSNDSYHSNVSHHTSAGSLRGNALSDGSDLRSGQEKSTNQVSKKNSARKFLYHPMGNLDEDEDHAHGAKKTIHRQAVAQQNAHFDQSMFSSQVPRSSMEPGKRQSSDGLRDGNGPADAHSWRLNMSGPLNRSIDTPSANIDSPSSPNVLQLLQKVDQSREYDGAMHQNASSEMTDAENSNDSMTHLQRSHSSASQRYGLLLGPPSQSMPTKNHLLPSQSSMQNVNSAIGDHVQSLSYARGTMQSEISNNRSRVPGSSNNESTLNMHGKFSSPFSSGYMHTRNLHESQRIVTGQGLTNHFNYSSKHAPNSTEKEDSHVKTFSRDVIDSNAHASLQTSSEALNNVSANSQSHLFGVQFREEQSHPPCSQQLNIVESSSSVLGCRGDQDGTNERQFSSKIDSNSVNLFGEDVQGEMIEVKPQLSRNIDLQNLNESQRDAIAKTISDVSPVNLKSMQKDTESFVKSLNQNKRVADGSLVDQQISHASPPSADSGMFGLPGPINPQRGSVPTQDMVSLRQNDSQSSSLANISSSVIREHTQINPQMAQSWFNRFGTTKNGQTLPMHEAQKAAAMQIAEPPFAFGKSTNSLHAINSMQQLMPANIDRSQQSNVGTSSLPTPAPVEHSPSSQPLSVDVIGQPSIPRPKKRRRVREDSSPWYKVVSRDLEDLENISGYSEQDWAKATNRATEKVVEEMGLTEVPPRQKARRRLFLTTQIMQQLFHPLSASILSADSKLAFENVAYLGCRLALGSACGLVSSSKRNTSLAKEDDDKEQLSDKHKTSEGSGDGHFSKIVEEFTERKRKLEDEFSKLDNSTSVLDLTLESQDLEKFSLINRFAKYYRRAQGNASSSVDVAARTQKAMPERYVTAYQFNKDHCPAEAQCLSL